MGGSFGVDPICIEILIRCCPESVVVYGQKLQRIPDNKGLLPGKTMFSALADNFSPTLLLLTAGQRVDGDGLRPVNGLDEPTNPLLSASVVVCGQTQQPMRTAADWSRGGRRFQHKPVLFRYTQPLIDYIHCGYGLVADSYGEIPNAAVNGLKSGSRVQSAIPGGICKAMITSPNGQQAVCPNAVRGSCNTSARRRSTLA